jgi:hypothetical protein
MFVLVGHCWPTFENFVFLVNERCLNVDGDVFFLCGWIFVFLG